jgi:hypothetical protein
LQAEHGLTRAQASTLLGLHGAVEFYEATLRAANAGVGEPEGGEQARAEGGAERAAAAAAVAVEPQAVAKLLLGDVAKGLYKAGLGFQDAPSSASPQRIAEVRCARLSSPLP